MDLLDLAHIVIAADTSWIALRVWKQTPIMGGATPNASAAGETPRPFPPFQQRGRPQRTAGADPGPDTLGRSLPCKAQKGWARCDLETCPGYPPDAQPHPADRQKQPASETRHPFRSA